jgi:hypothetical protein
MRRRDMLATLPALVGAGTRLARAAEPFYVHDGGEPGRLKVDFDSNRTKVRLLFMFSPT